MTFRAPSRDQTDAVARILAKSVREQLAEYDSALLAVGAGEAKVTGSRVGRIVVTSGTPLPAGSSPTT